MFPPKNIRCTVQTSTTSLAIVLRLEPVQMFKSSDLLKQARVTMEESNSVSHLPVLSRLLYEPLSREAYNAQRNTSFLCFTSKSVEVWPN